MRFGTVANTEFAKGSVHIEPKQVKNLLTQGACGRIRDLQPVEKQKIVQHNHIEASVQSVRHTKIRIEGGSPGLCHNLRIHSPGYGRVGFAGFEKVAKHLAVRGRIDME